MTYEILDDLIAKGNRARQYAWDHYEVLNAKETAYVLCGPDNHSLGVLAAGHATPARKRKLQRSTLAKRYLRYEFDQDFRLIRIRHMCNYAEIDCTYQMFEMDGILYGEPFFRDRKAVYPGDTIAVKFENGRPVYYAMSRKNYLCVDFYTYPQPDRVLTDVFLYSPNSQYCSTGLPVNWDAPFGAQDSPVTLDHRDEPYVHFDFPAILKSVFPQEDGK
jgi:hypothetical protein